MLDTVWKSIVGMWDKLPTTVKTVLLNAGSLALYAAIFFFVEAMTNDAPISAAVTGAFRAMLRTFVDALPKPKLTNAGKGVQQPKLSSLLV